MPLAEKRRNSLDFLDEEYNVMEMLGCGSVGVVHRAVQHASGLQFAVKTLRYKDATLVDAAKREYELLQALDPHPNIIQVVSFHSLKGEAALVLDFFDGVSLKIVAGRKPLQEKHARTLCAFLFDAVAHLHARNILHRDIKPENILVARDLSNLLLIDFNVAACLDEGPPLTPTGTRRYRAPELFRGESPCALSDVWASGMCIFFMLSGYWPQSRDNRRPSKGNKEKVPVHSTTLLGAECWKAPAVKHISTECKCVLTRCLATGREARSTMSELISDPWISDLVMRNRDLVAQGAESLPSV
jgi:serine/threonine protein kinase